MLVDTHSHLYWDSFQEDFKQVIENAQTAGVGMVITVGVDIEESRVAATLDCSPLTSYSTIGIHPHEAWRYFEKPQSLVDDMKKLEDIYHQYPEKVIGIGECGLDYFFENNPDYIPSSLTIEEQKQLQRELLTAHVTLAEKLNLPLIIHVRDDRSKNPTNSECWEEAINLTKGHFGIYHCYSGLAETTQRVLQETQFLISFAATLTYPKNEYLREAAKVIPLDRIVLETDCPFLPSQINRGKRNEPATVKEIAQLIAQLKGISFEEVADQTTRNVQKLFKLT